MLHPNMGAGDSFRGPHSSGAATRTAWLCASAPYARSAWLHPVARPCAAAALLRAAGLRAAGRVRAGPGGSGRVCAICAGAPSEGELSGDSPCGPVPACALAQRLAPTAAGMSAVDASGASWPAALACMRTACDRVQASMAGSSCASALAYSAAVGEWVRGLPEDGGSRVALQQPGALRVAGARLADQSPELQKARVVCGIESQVKSRTINW